MKPIKLNAFRNICATCKHLQAIETGREFDKIVDTEYTLFTCKVLGWKKKEFYLMASGEVNLNKQKLQICELWESWDSQL